MILEEFLNVVNVFVIHLAKENDVDISFFLNKFEYISYKDFFCHASLKRISNVKS